MGDDKNLRFIIDMKITISDETIEHACEIFCDHKYKLTKIEFEQILTQIIYSRYYKLHTSDKVDKSKYDFRVFWNLTTTNPEITKLMLEDLTDFDPIPRQSNNQAYNVNIHWKTDGIMVFDCGDCTLHKEIKSQHKRSVISIKKPPCRYMKQHIKTNKKCNVLKTINRHFQDEKKQDRILKHLQDFDHFEYFGKKRELCPYKTNKKCIHFQRILNNNYQHKFVDKKHLYMYYHKASNHHFAANNSAIIDNTQFPLFEYGTILECKINQIQSQLQKQFLPSPCLDENQQNYLLLLLIREVIDNNFETDLKPIPIAKTNEMSFNGKQFIDDIFKQYNNNGSMKCFNSDTIKHLSKHYGIFKILDEKMNHEKHQQMDNILFKAQMLSLILYCNGTVDGNLSSCQRDGTYIKKWPMFDSLLNSGIIELSKYEIHDENIYSGLNGALLDFYQLYRQANFSCLLHFKSNVSFTKDLNVAYQFRGAEGMVLGINLKQSLEEDIFGHGIKSRISACDVSWISRFPLEQEVLISRHSQFNVYVSKSKQIDKKQWIVCNLGCDDKTFEKVFPTMVPDVIKS